MIRFLLTAAASGAGMAVLLLWLAARDLREPWRLTPVPTPDPEDDDWIQPADPVTVRWTLPHTPTIGPGYGTGDVWPHDHYTISNVEPVPMDDWPELPAYSRPLGGM